MPQWRKLHVKTTESHDLNDMPDDFTRLMWVLMPLGLDSAGRGIDDSSWLKSKLFPLRRDIGYHTIEQAMNWYSDRGMIIRYEVDGRHYFYVPTFAKYQGKTDREATSLIPDPVKRGRKNGSRVGHDQVVSKSSSDADADADAEEIHSNGTPAPKPEKPEEALSEGQRLFKDTWGVKFLNSSQKAEILALEKYGMEKLTAGVRWAHTEGMAFGRAINALKTALPKWDKPKPSATNGKSQSLTPAQQFMQKHGVKP